MIFKILGISLILFLIYLWIKIFNNVLSGFRPTSYEKLYNNIKPGDHLTFIGSDKEYEKIICGMSNFTINKKYEIIHKIYPTYVTIARIDIIGDNGVIENITESELVFFENTKDIRNKKIKSILKETWYKKLYKNLNEKFKI